MQAGTSLFLALCGVGLLLASPVLAQNAPTPGQRAIVSGGPLGKVVNEPALSQLPNEFPITDHIALWQIQDPPPAGETEAPYRIAYIVGDYDAITGTLDWDVPLTSILMPPMGYSMARNPAVVPTFEVDQWRFVAAGQARTESVADDSFVIPGESEELEFDYNQAIVFGSATTHATLYPRLGVRHRGQFEGGGDLGISNDVVHLLAWNNDFTQGPVGQVFLRRSNNSGLSWTTDWEKMTLSGGVPIVGYPSAPDFDRFSISQEDPTYVVFSYADDQATYIELAYRLADTAGDSLDASLNVHPALTVRAGQHYFERSNESIAGDFGIRPFTSMVITDPGNVYVVWHDLEDSDEEGTVLDGDFNIFIKRGHIVDGVWVWSPAQRVSFDDDDVRADAFMPCIVAEQDHQGRLHVAWYDTRLDLQNPDEEVKISLYYARITDRFNDTHQDGPFIIERVLLESEAIDTRYLTNPKFLGDRIDIACCPTSRRRSCSTWARRIHGCRVVHPSRSRRFRASRTRRSCRSL